MTDAELLKIFQTALSELELRKAASDNHIEARHLSLCYTHTEDAILRLNEVARGVKRGGPEGSGGADVLNVPPPPQPRVEHVDQILS